MPDSVEPGAAAPVGGVPGPVLRLGTWNMTHWSAAKVSLVAATIPADLLAIQETHLAKVPLMAAHTTARRAGLHLHHGRPATPVPHSEHAKSCGVGFLCREDVAVASAIPSCPSWRRLEAMRRVHGVRLPPRVSLPLGVLILSVYAPLPRSAERPTFDSVFMSMVHALDMQTPTILLGDFNGALNPASDYLSDSGSRRPPCPLLADLLGPGRPWIDVHAALLPPPLPWTYRHAGPAGKLFASRIDLVLANPAAMRLVRGATVQDTLVEGGHSPVLVDLALDPGRIQWRPPLPRPPPLLREPSSVLASSADWDNLIQRWQSSPEALALAPDPAVSLDSLAVALRAALQRLVTLAGGWTTRPRTRRLAYDSNAIRLLRTTLADLHRVHTLCSRALKEGTPGAWPHFLMHLLDSLASRGVVLPRSGSLAELQVAALTAVAPRRAEVDRLVRHQRAERTRRFREALPQLWKDDLGVIQRWLRADSVPWGSRPILDAAGLQCLTVPEVDAAVRAFWVDHVLRQHAAVDEDARWTAFLASPFSQHIPTATWPTSSWDAARVRASLRSMREGAAPGLTGVPIAVWRALPSPWPEAVARLLNLVESERRWPSSWLEAYVAMIPKSAGGTRPQDQRPITVLEVLYRLWAKGIVTTWGSTLQNGVLSDTAFGFRSGRGTLHAAQVVADLLSRQRQRRAELWLVSFDLAKCFDSLPWWAVFRMLRAVGVEEKVVACFSAFYRDVRRRFRYGAVLGEAWCAANGLAQGCPASPDLLNLLFEPFHRWAAAERLGVDVGDLHVASVSFADDLTLIAPAQPAAEKLIAAYLQWCALLGVQVTKVQAWSSLGPGRAVIAGTSTIVTTANFRFVGIELGLPGSTGDDAHWKPRLEKALVAAQRLRSLPLPAALQAVLWRSTVLPKALYGCELRDVPGAVVSPLIAAGKAAVSFKAPLHLNTWTAPEIALGWPLGDTAALHPLHYVRLQQLRWLQLLANSTGLAGTIHRAVAYPSAATTWREPSRALRSALKHFNWQIVRNLRCQRSTTWPRLLPEPSFLGTVLLSPSTDAPEPQAVYTDGSLATSGGGSAVWQPDTEETFMLHVPAARSSTQCELVALTLAMQLLPMQVLSDSLCALQLVRRWPEYSDARRLACPDRVEVRELLAATRACLCPPILEKVRAHDERGVQLGDPKALGNDAVDAFAKRAAAGETSRSVQPLPPDRLLGPFGDPVVLLDHNGSPILSAVRSVPSAFWRRSRATWSARRPRLRLDMLFPQDLEFDWQASVGIFRRPVILKGAFSHRVAPRVIKWISRMRCGCLATRDRLQRKELITSAGCLCCGAALEDDLHVLTGCPATGSADYLALLREAWTAAVTTSKLRAPLPPLAWLEAHRLPLLAALIPSSTLWHHPLGDSDSSRFKAALHVALAERVAELHRRRGELMATCPQRLPSSTAAAPDDVDDPAVATEAGSSSSTRPGLRLPCVLPPERRLSVADLLVIERGRRCADPPPPDPTGTTAPATSTPPQPPPPPPPPALPAQAPPCGELRRVWLHARLIELLNDQQTVQICAPAAGSYAEELLYLFEAVTGEQYTQTPGASWASRRTGFGKALGNLLESAEVLPRLLGTQHRGKWRYNRHPLQRRDLDLLQQQRLRAEAAQPVAVTGMGMAEAGAKLVAFLRDRTRFAEAAVETGETSLALLLLWEAEFQQSFPSTAGGSESDLVMGFTRRLRNLVARDDDLSGWLQSDDINSPLAPGLPPSHCRRWGLRIIPPTPTSPWPAYDVFIERWQARMRALAAAPPPPPIGVRRPRATEDFHPAQRRRANPPSRPAAPRPPAAPVPQSRTSRPRSPTIADSVPTPKRQCTLGSWLQPQRAPPPHHGRAVEGPPT